MGTLKEKLAEWSKKRHEKRCAAGKHDWYTYSEETIEYSYSSVGGANPTYSTKELHCLWCDAVDYVSSGDIEEYERSVNDDVI